MVMPSACRLFIMENISLTSMGERPMLGSSSSSIFGSVMSARPMASICCSPPESVPASCRVRSARRGKWA